MEYTREEIIKRLKEFELGYSDPRAAFSSFWSEVIKLLEQDSHTLISDMIEGMRDLTPEESKSVSDYISSVSKQTGLNIYDLLEGDK